MRPSLMISSLMTSSNMSWWILFGWGLCKVADPFSASSVGSDPWLLVSSDPGALVGIRTVANIRACTDMGCVGYQETLVSPDLTFP
jgi:hypothetical protein